MHLVLGLLLAALLAPFGPIALRAWALARARQDPVAAWFGFSIRLHGLSLVVLAMPILAMLFRNEMRPWFEQSFVAPIATQLRFAVGLLPVALFHASATLVAHDLSRILRGVETPRRVAVELAAIGAAMILVPLSLLASSWSAFDTWGLEAGIVMALLAVVVPLALGVRAQKLQGLTLHSITTGPLRDRAFDLAARARVRLDQVYALPLSKWKHANAFATEGRQVLVTDYLLEHLDREEVDAVLAHEIAHLAGKDPERQTRLLVALTWASLMLAIFGVSPAVTLAWILAAVLIWLGYSRRCEYGADARAQALGVVPQAAITGLAKLNRLGSVPTDYPRFVEWWLTHPSTERRARAMGSRAGLARDEIERLLTLPETQAVRPHYPAPELDQESKGFTTTFKRSVLVRNSMLTILVGIAASLAFVNLARAIEVTGWVRLGLWPIVAILVATAMLAVFDRLATARFGRVARAAFERLAPSDSALARDGLEVGFAPHEIPHLYEGFTVWDVGRLDLLAGRLDYRGEQVRFSLNREDVLDVCLVGGSPGWIPTARVLVRWRRADGRNGVFALAPSVAPRLSRVHALAQALHASVHGWWSKPTTQGRHSETGLGDPPTAEVTGQAPGSEITRQGLGSLVVLYAIGTSLLGLAARMPAGFSNEPGLIDAFLAATLGNLVLLIPLIRSRRAALTSASKELESDASRAA